MGLSPNKKLPIIKEKKIPQTKGASKDKEGKRIHYETYSADRHPAAPSPPRATENGLAPQISSEEMLDYVPAAREFCTIDAVQILNIDSTNLQPEHWLLMARTVRENYGQI